MFAKFFIDRPIFAWVIALIILLGGGLMAAGFLSSNSGHDERVAGATSAQPVVDEHTNDERNIA